MTWNDLECAVVAICIARSDPVGARKCARASKGVSIAGIVLIATCALGGAVFGIVVAVRGGV